MSRYRRTRRMQVFLLTVWDPNGSSFTLQADLSSAGVNLQPTATVYADAVAMRTQDLLGELNNGSGIAESVKNRLSAWYARLRLHVDRGVDALPAAVRTQ